jgi:hypothetical protein
MPFVVVAVSGQRRTIGRPRAASTAFKRLDVWFLVHRKRERPFGRVKVKVKANDLHRLATKSGPLLTHQDLPPSRSIF